MNIKKNLPFLLTAILLLSTATACTGATPQPTAAATAAVSPTPGLPRSEAGVPRVTPADAKAAFDRGEAVIVDVRGPDAYARGHIAGAISIPLGEFETNVAGLSLDKQQWIITYCT
ncbi:MAG TPA: rhodanese-like domain-containing protein [Anaerolineales bacterium]|jgi:3-mercaptopyruvate sulfurtransferase SseA